MELANQVRAIQEEVAALPANQQVAAIDSKAKDLASRFAITYHAAVFAILKKSEGVS